MKSDNDCSFIFKKKKKGEREGTKLVFQQFIQSSVGFGEDAYSCAEQLVSFIVAFSEGLEGMWRMVDSGLSVLRCLPGLWFTSLGSTWLVDLRSRRCFF